MTVLLSDTYPQCLRTVDQLRDLPQDWDSYGAFRADPKSLKLAKGLLFELSKIPGLWRPGVYLAPSGFVGLIWYWGGHEYELSVTVNPNGTMEYGYLGADGEREGEVALSEAAVLVKSLLLQGATNG